MVQIFGVGDKGAMLKNCERFLEKRCLQGGDWKSYTELKAENEILRKAVSQMRQMFIKILDEMRAERIEDKSTTTETVPKNLLAISDADFLADSVRCQEEALRRLQQEPSNSARRLEYEYWLNRSLSFAESLKSK